MRKTAGIFCERGNVRHRVSWWGVRRLTGAIAIGLLIRAARSADGETLAPVSRETRSERSAEGADRSALRWEQIKARMEFLQRTLPACPSLPALRHEWATVHFHLRKMRYVVDTYALSTTALRLLEESLATAEQAWRFVTGSNRWERISGLREEAYWSPNDASFQPFLRYWPLSTPSYRPLPLIVFLHGYSPTLDIANWAYLPRTLLEYAEREPAGVLAPFGRGNTDFQGIGEQDVLEAIRVFREHYPVDAHRIILAGYSMGGMGAYTLAAHQPDFFAGVLVISGRGDYYRWRGVAREALPSYKRDWVDAHFGYSRRAALTRVPFLIFHGTADPVVPLEEARHMVSGLMQAGAHVTYTELEDSHWIAEPVFAHPDTRRWLAHRRRTTPPSLRPESDYYPSPAGPIPRAFLGPFLFVCTAHPTNREETLRFHRMAHDWYRYAKAWPQTLREIHAVPSTLADFNLFAFGEPENSALIQRILEGSPVGVRDDRFVVGSRNFPRPGNGMYVVRPNPWNPKRLAVVQCGLRWGEGLPENHKYDYLPDYIVYTAEYDADGSNAALCAGFFDGKWNLDPARQYVRPAAVNPSEPCVMPPPPGRDGMIHNHLPAAR